MTRPFALLTLLVLSLDHAHCQDVPKGPAFDVASITPCKPGTRAPEWEHSGMAPFNLPGGRFRANATTLKFLLEWAYRIQPFQHSGGPSWMEEDRYDIEAKAAGNITEAEMRLAVQTLLTDRFKLKFHRESRVLPVYVISMGKTAPKLFPSKDDETHAIQVTPQKGADPKLVSYRVTATRFSLAQFTDMFSRQFGSAMVNQTGLDGDFNFTLDLIPDESRPNPLDPSLLIAAMRDQLGLKLTSQKAPVDFLVIDSAEKVAAGNQ